MFSLQTKIKMCLVYFLGSSSSNCCPQMDIDLDFRCVFSLENYLLEQFVANVLKSSGISDTSFR